MERLRRACRAHFAALYGEKPVLLWGAYVPDDEAAPLLALVGESPSERDVLAGTLLAGRAGRAMNAMLEALAWPPAYVTAAVKRRTVRSDGTSRPPTREEIALWSPWLKRELAIVKPGIIVALGATAQRALGSMAHVAIRHPAAPGMGREEWAANAGRIRALMAQAGHPIEDN